MDVIQLRQRPFAYYETIAGGMGAGPEHDGHSATHTHMTNSWNTPVEALEHQLPLRIRDTVFGEDRAERAPGAEAMALSGSGSFWSGAKVDAFVRPAGPRTVWACRVVQPGQPGANTLVRRGKRTTIPAKTEFQAEPGDVLRIETPGGGGHGHPV